MNDNKGLTQKQENFTLNIFKGMTQRDAYIDAYRPTYAITTIDGNASTLANQQKIIARLHELQQEVAKGIIEDKIATTQEIMEVLTEIIRARFNDFVDADGHLDIAGKDKLKNAALQELKTTRWTGGKDERASSITSTIKLRDPIAAVQELNKMRGSYAPERHAVLGDILIEVVYREGRNKELSETTDK